tara:strand:+ start:37981 stop:38958 length:978 start_codon:yes stop_codon:yes gene_type:complete
MFVKYPSIDNLRTVIKEQKKFNPLSLSKTISLEGTTKIHGTNAGVTVDLVRNCSFQSRNRILSVDDDNFGFASFASGNQDFFKRMADRVDYKDFDNVTFFGEWCGGNIQKNIGISGMEKAFVVFSVVLSKNDDEQKEFIDIEFVKSCFDIRVFNVRDFGVFCVDLVMNNTDSLMAVEQLTSDLEKNCPVALQLNPSGNMIGEGIVWSSQDGRVRFKQKGEKHAIAGSSPKVKIEAPITGEAEIAVNCFLDQAVSLDRLKQSADYLLEMGFDFTTKNTGNYIKWMNKDVLKELRFEIDDIKEKHGIEWKYLCKIITNVSKEHFNNL